MLLRPWAHLDNRSRRRTARRLRLGSHTLTPGAADRYLRPEGLGEVRFGVYSCFTVTGISMFTFLSDRCLGPCTFDDRYSPGPSDQGCRVGGYECHLQSFQHRHREHGIALPGQVRFF